MSTISLCMIVKNEEAVLSNCLSSVADLVDEIIIVDTGSTDRTKEIATSFGARLFDFKWIDDFSAARNYAFEQGTCDYLFWLDADDVLLPEDRDKFKQLKNNLNNEPDVIMMRYQLGSLVTGKPQLTYFRERLLKRSSGFRWQEPVHECIQPRGIIINSDIAVTHTRLHASASGRNLKILEREVAKGAGCSSRSLYYYARELYENGQFQNAISVFLQFLERVDSWLEDRIIACRDLAECYRLTGHEDMRLPALFKTLAMDVPRAEICCAIGNCLKERQQFQAAVFWYKSALNAEKPTDSWGFVQPDCYDYIPLLELCVCYDRLGDYDKAEKCNQQAALLRPNDPAILHNQQYFLNIKNGLTAKD